MSTGYNVVRCYRGVTMETCDILSDMAKRDPAKDAKFAEAYGSGLDGKAAGIVAGHSPTNASTYAKQTLASGVINEQVLAKLHETAASWLKLVTRAKEGLARNLNPKNWEPRYVTKTHKGEELTTLMPAAVRASDINTAAKIVIDSLRTIDAATLSEKAQAEDESEGAVTRATKILGDHGVH